MWAPDQGGEGQVWRKVNWILFNSLSLLYLQEGEEAIPCHQTILALRDGGQFFDDALETPVRGRVSQGCYLGGFSNSMTYFNSAYESNVVLKI